MNLTGVAAWEEGGIDTEGHVFLSMEQLAVPMR